MADAAEDARRAEAGTTGQPARPAAARRPLDRGILATGRRMIHGFQRG